MATSCPALEGGANRPTARRGGRKGGATCFSFFPLVSVDVPVERISPGAPNIDVDVDCLAAGSPVFLHLIDRTDRSVAVAALSPMSPRSIKNTYNKHKHMQYRDSLRFASHPPAPLDLNGHDDAELNKGPEMITD